jgi:hypothetical protein
MEKDMSQINLDQSRKAALQKINYLWRNPELSDKEREEALVKLEEIIKELSK